MPPAPGDIAGDALRLTYTRLMRFRWIPTLALLLAACSSNVDVSTVPELPVASAADVQDILATTDTPVVVNVWASWCVSCRAEHPVLNQLARSSEVPILGLNYKDGREVAQQWLRQRGDPYTVSAFDEDGRAGLDWGVYGVPETFVIDRQGIIRHKHIGPLTREVVTSEILPLVARLEAEQ